MCEFWVGNVTCACYVLCSSTRGNFTKFLARLNFDWANDSIIHTSGECSVSSVAAL